MRILQIVHGFPPACVGGTERYTEAAAWGLARKGHTSIVLSGSEEIRPIPTITTEDRDGLSVATYFGSIPNPVHWSPPYRPEAEQTIIRYLKDVRPDVVHVQHWPRLTINLVAICKSLGIPTVITLHDLWSTCPLGYRLRWDRQFCLDPFSTAPCVTCVHRRDGETDEEIAAALTVRERLVAEELRLADRVLAPSEALKEFLMTLLPDEDGVRIDVLPHATTGTLSPRRIASMNPPPVPLGLGYWGSLAWWKGPHLLLEALHYLPNPRMVEAHLFGEAVEPAYLDQLNSLAEGLAVVFHGAFRPPDLSRAAFQVAVFPSLCFESYSLVLDEALQLGIPVIVPDRGAPAERIGSAGLTFKTGEARDLARQIQRVIEEPGLLERFQHGQPAAPLVGLDDHVTQLEAIYRQVTAADRAGRNGVSQRSVDASIVIRSKNEARYIGEVLEQLFAQSYHGSFEVLLLDSGSQDDTVKVASAFPVSVHAIDPDEFTFGRALNQGARLANGDYVIYLSAHCTPTDKEWLTRLTQPLMDDPQVAATWGRQEPRMGVNPFEEMELGWTFPADDGSHPPVMFSCANCAIRRELVIRLPFDETSPFAEDYIWCKRLPAPYRVTYIPSASVYHSHPLSLRYWANRSRLHGQLIPFLTRTYGMEYYGPPSQSPMRGFLQWSRHLVRQEYRYCLDNRYFFHWLLIPLYEGVRLVSFWRGLKEGRTRQDSPLI